MWLAVVILQIGVPRSAQELRLSQGSVRSDHSSIARDQCAIDCGFSNSHLGNAPTANDERSRHSAEMFAVSRN
jgi:hypothetical protein